MLLPSGRGPAHLTHLLRSAMELQGLKSAELLQQVDLGSFNMDFDLLQQELEQGSSALFHF